MTTTDAARRAGFLAQLNVSGESVLLPSGEVVTALINRAVVSGARRAGLPDYTTKTSATVEIATPLPVVPKAGDYLGLVGSPSVRFRVAEVLVETVYSVRLNCQPFNPQATI